MKHLTLIAGMLLMVLTLHAQDKTQKYKTLKDLSYISADDTSAYRRERCLLDIYMPVDNDADAQNGKKAKPLKGKKDDTQKDGKTDTPAGKKGFKTIVWFHGGGLEGGNKELRPELMNSGFAIVAPNYRLFPRCKCPDYTRDAAAAVAWTVKHIAEYGGDPSQVYVGGHSAGGYLTLMLALDKSYLGEWGVDADSIKGYFPVSGQCATHYTIRKERKISYTLPIVDKMAPLNNARRMTTRLVLITGDRRLEQTSRYEENLYLKSVLDGMGNATIPIHELSGFDHGTVLAPACMLIRDIMRKDR